MFAVSSKIEILSARVSEELGEKERNKTGDARNLVLFACAHHILPPRSAARLRFHPLLVVLGMPFGSKGSNAWRWRQRAWKKPERWQ